MPLVGFRPTKARLVVEDARASVVVLKVALDDDAVLLATGGNLADLAGVLRIRESEAGSRAEVKATSLPGDASLDARRQKIGTLVYVPESGEGADVAPAKFQVDITMSTEKFAHLLRAANAGRMPTRFMVDASDNGRGLAYRRRGQAREKVWDNVASRVLAVTHFVMILPLDIPAGAAAAPLRDTSLADASLATNAQVAEMMDDMLTFQSDTRTTMFGLVCVLAVVALAALALGIATLVR
jgi:hypothetical protein